MKKTIITLAIIFGLGIGAFAQQDNGGGLFQYGSTSDYFYGSEWNNYNRDGLALNVALMHGLTGSQPAPLGGGALLLIGFGAAYAMGKRRKE